MWIDVEALLQRAFLLRLDLLIPILGISLCVAHRASLTRSQHGTATLLGAGDI